LVQNEEFEVEKRLPSFQMTLGGRSGVGSSTSDIIQEAFVAHPHRFPDAIVSQGYRVLAAGTTEHLWRGDVRHTVTYGYSVQ